MESNFQLTDKIKRQFDFSPYPRIPLERTPHDNYDLLYQHSMVTPYYMRHQQVVDTRDKVILDAGCGSGWKSLILAVANPGAKIIGIDLSPESTKLAEYRLKHHGFDDAEFYPLAIEDVQELGVKFDYINCDEVLYLLPEPATGLKALQSVLQPQGIIRTNLHSSTQRYAFFRAQKLFKFMGLLEDNPEDMEIDIVRETMESLKDVTRLKMETWGKAFQDLEQDKFKESVLMNHLFQGDKGYTIPELFSALKQSELDFIGMLNWRQWEILDLFKDADNLPMFWAMGLMEVSEEERLHLFELLHPVHRLLDFWCTHTNSLREGMPLSEWGKEEWQGATVHLHPLLQTEKVKTDLVNCIREQKPFEISQYIKTTVTKPIHIESHLAACLLPLWETAQPSTALVERWLRIRPIHPDTLEPVRPETAFAELVTWLKKLEIPLYILLDAEK